MLKYAISMSVLVWACGVTVAGAQEDNVAAEDVVSNDGADEKKGVNDTIIVTGEKIERSLQDTVSSVVVYDVTTIKEQNFTDVFDLINQTANVAGLADDGGFTIRGLQNEGVGGAATSDVATVYLDGVFLPSNLFTASPVNLWDLQGVEVFRGPQSTIQGRNALIGAIVARTVDPGEEFSGDAQLRYGNFGSFRGSAALTFPILPGQVGLRVSGDYNTTDGFVENVTLDRDDAAGSESITTRAKLLLTPAAIPELKARLNFSYIDVERENAGIVEGLFPGERVTFQNLQNQETSESFLVSAQIDYALTDKFSLTSVSSYIDTDGGRSFDVDSMAGGADSPAFSSSQDEVFSQELRLSYASDRIDALFGGYYFNSTSRIQNEGASAIDSDRALPDSGTLAALLAVQLGLPLPPPAPLVTQAVGLRNLIVATIPEIGVFIGGGQAADIENFAFFAETNFDVTDKLTLGFGARYDNENVVQDISILQLVQPLPSTGNATADLIVSFLTNQFSSDTQLAANNTFDAFLPKGVISYKWTDDLSTSFSVQRAYRAGGLSFNNFQLNRGAALQGLATQEEFEAAGIVNRFDPEFTTNYELSLRSQWFDRRLTVNANAFLINYDEQQILLVLSANVQDNIVDNVGRSRLKGFEFETFANPLEGLDLFANFGFTDTEFLESSDLLEVLETVDPRVALDITGNEFISNPRWTAGFGGRYTHETGLFANLRFRYTGSSFRQVNNDPSALNDSFTTVDVILGYEKDNYSIEVFANNLFDDDFLTNNPVDDPILGPSVTGAFGVAGAPQTFGLRLTSGF